MSAREQRHRTAVRWIAAIRAVIRAENSLGRQELFRRYAARQPLARFAEWVHGELGRSTFAAAFPFLYGLKPLLFFAPLPMDDGSRSSDVAALGVFNNDVRQIKDLCTRTGLDSVQWFTTHPRILLGRSPMTVPRRLVSAWPSRLRTVRVIGRITQGRGFLVACRVARMVCCYEASKRALLCMGRRPAVALVASDFDAEALGLVLAAEELGIRTLFVAHAHPTTLSPSLRFDVSIVDGPAAHADYAAKGPIRGKVAYKGADGPHSKPLKLSGFSKARPRIGLFASKELNVERLVDLLEKLVETCEPEQILIRWHPNMLQPRPLEETRHVRQVVHSPAGTPLHDDVARCDWVMADQCSNVHLTTLRLGVPTVAVAGLSVNPVPDLYGFVRRRVIPQPISSVGSLSLDAVRTFYSDSSWVERFRYYDAAYGLETSDIDDNLKRAIQPLLQGREA